MELKENVMPLVTVFVPSCNHEKYVLETLESIKNQTYKNYELIIIDDFSTDNTVAIIDKWINENKFQCKFIKHSYNQGIIRTMNEFLENAKGKYYSGCASDDIWLPEKLEKQVKMLELSDENTALVFSDALLINSEGELYQNKFIAYHRQYLSLKSGNFFNELILGNFIPAMTVTLKTDIIRKIGNWDENLTYEDYDMWLRLASKYNFIYDEQPTAKYRLHNANLHNSIPDFSKSNFLIFLKHIENEYANSFCENHLKSLYINNKKELRDFSKLYFEKKFPSDFMLKCIKSNVPYIIFRIIRLVAIILKKCLKLLS